MGTFDNKTKGRYDIPMNDNSEHDVNPDTWPRLQSEPDQVIPPNGARDVLGFPRHEDDLAEPDAVVSDEVVGEIQDENGEVVEVHLVKPATPTAAESDFPLGKYGKFGVRASDPRIADRGPGVERLLSHLGVGGDTFTPEVEDQVRQVQEEKGLPVTGQVDRLTWDAITSL